MPYYVCKGAKLKCSMGTMLSELGVIHTGKPVYLHGENMANITDCKSKQNIKPFGLCTSGANPAVSSKNNVPQPCEPVIISQWTSGKTDVLVKDKPALMNNDKLMCMWAGMIEITDEGQAD